MFNDHENPYASPSAPVEEDSPEVTNSSRIFVLNGRIGRWRFLAYGGLLSFATGLAIAIPFLIVSQLIPDRAIVHVLNIATNLCVLLPILLMARRRLQDMDHSGWWTLTLIVPLVNFLTMLYLVFGPGIRGRNRYGAPPSKNPAWVCPASLLMAATIRAMFAAT
jgi:uncharacterized membrane protein YhaH (DUF805 family)